MHDEWSNCSSMAYVTERTRQMTHRIQSIGPVKPPSVKESNSAILEWRLQAKSLVDNGFSGEPRIGNEKRRSVHEVLAEAATSREPAKK